MGCEDTLRPLRSSLFYTNIPDSYVEYIIKEGAPKSGLEFEMKKEVYSVIVSFLFIIISLQPIMN